MGDISTFDYICFRAFWDAIAFMIFMAVLVLWRIVKG